jgi:hypothetical protein
MLAFGLDLMLPVPLLVVVPESCLGAWPQAPVVLGFVPKRRYEHAGIDPWSVPFCGRLEATEATQIVVRCAIDTRRCPAYGVLYFDFFAVLHEQNIGAQPDPSL